MADVSDNFNRADEDPLSGGGNWVKVASGGVNLKVVSNAVRITTAMGEMMWDANSFADDQYGEVLGQTSSPTLYAGPLVRCSATGSNANYYMLLADGGAPTYYYFYKKVNGTETAIGSNPIVLGSSSRATYPYLRITATGTTIAGFNGSSSPASNNTIRSSTDSSLSSGKVGMRADGGASYSIDDWIGGPIVSVGGRKRIRRMISAKQLTGMALLGVLIKNPSFSRKEMMDIIRWHK